MTDQLPATQTSEFKPREPLPEVKKFPDPVDQKLVDAILRDPLTSATEHLLRIQPDHFKNSNSAKDAAHRRLKKKVVQEYMRVQQARLRHAANLEQDDLQEMLTMVMRTDISQVASWDADGTVRFKPKDQLPAHALRSIKKIKTRTTKRYFKDGGSEETINTELELYSHLEAIELYARISGILKGEGRGGDFVNNGVIILPPTSTEQEALKGKRIYEG